MANKSNSSMISQSLSNKFNDPLPELTRVTVREGDGPDLIDLSQNSFPIEPSNNIDLTKSLSISSLSSISSYGPIKQQISSNMTNSLDKIIDSNDRTNATNDDSVDFDKAIYASLNDTNKQIAHYSISSIDTSISNDKGVQVDNHVDIKSKDDTVIDEKITRHPALVRKTLKTSKSYDDILINTDIYVNNQNKSIVVYKKPNQDDSELIDEATRLNTFLNGKNQVIDNNYKHVRIVENDNIIKSNNSSNLRLYEKHATKLFRKEVNSKFSSNGVTSVKCLAKKNPKRSTSPPPSMYKPISPNGLISPPPTTTSSHSTTLSSCSSTSKYRYQKQQHSNKIDAFNNLQIVPVSYNDSNSCSSQLSYQRPNRILDGYNHSNNVNSAAKFFYRSQYFNNNTSNYFIKHFNYAKNSSANLFNRAHRSYLANVAHNHNFNFNSNLFVNYNPNSYFNADFNGNHSNNSSYWFNRL